MVVGVWGIIEQKLTYLTELCFLFWCSSPKIVFSGSFDSCALVDVLLEINNFSIGAVLSINFLVVNFKYNVDDILAMKQVKSVVFA